MLRSDTNAFIADHLLFRTHHEGGEVKLHLAAGTPLVLVGRRGRVRLPHAGPNR